MSGVGVALWAHWVLGEAAGSGSGGLMEISQGVAMQEGRRGPGPEGEINGLGINGRRKRRDGACSFGQHSLLGCHCGGVTGGRAAKPQPTQLSMPQSTGARREGMNITLGGL